MGSALIRAEQSRRLNLRALVRSDSGPSLRHGMEALEHSAVVVRSMMRSFADGLQGYQAAGREIAPDVRSAFRMLLVKLAAALRTYGALVRAQTGPDAPERQLAEHHAALTDLRDARADVTDLLMVSPHDDPLLVISVHFPPFT